MSMGIGSPSRSSDGPGGASGIEVEIRIGHLWTVRDDKAVRLEVFPAREDARKAAERG